MCDPNQTQVTQIKLLGFQGLYKFRILLFIVFLLTYMMILSGNILIIFLVTTVDQLKFPMYFFLKYLATSDVLMTTSVVPMALDIILKDEGRLSLDICITQLYFFCICSYLQCFLIAIMSYDRYLAICNPLRYPSLINSHVCLQVIIGLCFCVIILVSSELIMIYRFDYCGLNYIDHFFCDFFPVVELSTSDTSSLKLQDFIISIITICLPFAFIIITYICIIVTILKISSAHGRRKAFSTCSSHVTLVGAFYGALIIVYMTPSDESSSYMNKYRSLLYVMVSPLINPIIYSLRNRDIKAALQKTLADFRNFVRK
ncbi:olfactory receptor 2D2-like [Aquarana catesbeiana]|uniref:olfactory receptor 2D2-like n=1 Tax=Aquarana catesbeiana TaxID=8400 RepID=UPI003CC9DE3A